MLVVKNLYMKYSNDFVALKKANITFKSGDFTVLLGTSGAGKSTLLRCLNFLNTPTSGEITAKDIGRIENTHHCLRRHRRQTAMIFQQHQLIPRQTALTNVLMASLGRYNTFRSFFPLPRKEKIIALECLERVGLLEKALTRVDNLSGGQQQRVGIARALAQRPQLILADEPIASLDPETSNKVLSILHRIAKEDNISAIVSLHQVEMARLYGDRVVGLADGQIVFDGDIDSLTDEALTKIYKTRPHTPPETKHQKVPVPSPGTTEPIASM